MPEMTPEKLARLKAEKTDHLEATGTSDLFVEGDDFDALIEIAEAVEMVRRLVDEQAEDEGLWFVAKTAPEAYLQQELRRLHSVIESTL